MEVMNLGVKLQSKYQVKNDSTSIKEGDVSQVFIKERLPDNSAKVIFKGQQVEVKFDGPVPTQDRVFVEVTKLNESGQLVVKPTTNSPFNKTVDTLLLNAGFDPATHIELKEAVKQILSGGGRVSKEELGNLQDFLKNDTGTLAEKLETLKTMQRKNIEFTKVQLQAVNAALNGESLMESLSEWMENEVDFQPTLVLDMKKPHDDTEQMVKVPEKLPENTQNEVKPQTLLKPEESPPELKEKIKPVIQEVQTKTEKMEPASPERLTNLITKPVESSPQLQQPVTNEAIPMDSKLVMVTEITKKLSQLTLDFKQVRQDMTRNLATASSLIQAKSSAPAQQVLDATIHNLDKAILKSDFMLYADMDTEKSMMLASSKLAEAKTLLSKGNFSEANQIVKEVKSELEKIVFNPADQKIKNFVSEQSPKAILDKVLQPADSGRAIFEKIKALGFTHEVETARAITDKQEGPHNLKSILMQMSEADSGKIAQPLANITGQQLLSKPDTSGIQNMLMQLPILLNKEVENVKIFVNSQKKGEKIDWENCSLYFVLETKRLGEVGIQISAVNRNLSITFKNDQETLQETVKPLTEIAKVNLQEIGYHVGQVQFKPFTEVKKEKIEESPKVKKKGFDFSI